MTREREALKLALEALMEHGTAYLGHSKEYQQAVIKSKEALALTSTPCEVQPEQEPVAWFIDVTTGGLSTQDYQVAARDHWGDLSVCFPLYTTSPKREWVGLTVEQIEDVGFNLLPTVAQKDFVEFARYVEMLSKEKNS